LSISSISLQAKKNIAIAAKNVIIFFFSIVIEI
jgi:hypothetical protein